MKFARKSIALLSLALCIAMLFTMGAPLAVYAGGTEDFGDGDSTPQLSSEWSGLDNTATETGSKIDTTPVSSVAYNTDSKNALYVNAASAASVTVALDGTAAFDAISFDVYPESIGTDGIRVSFGNAVSLLFKRAADSAVDTPIHLYYTAGGTDTDTGITLSNGAWFTVQVMTVEADGKANLSVNGGEAVSIDASHVAVTSFKVESLGRNDAYIDNVKVTETGTEEAVYAEDFEAVPAGELPDGYSAVGSGIAVGAGASLAACVVANANSIVKTFSPALEGVGDIYFEVYFDEAGYKGAHVRFYSSDTMRCGLIFSRGVQDVNAPIMLSYDDPTSTRKATNALHKTFVPIAGYELKTGVHYQFRIAPSTTTNKSILYVNGEQVSEIYTNTSLTGIDKMEVLGTGSSETLPVSIYVDNIRIYGQGSDVPVFTETFAGATAGTIPTGWVKDGSRTVNILAENCSYKKIAATSALHVWQNAGQAVASATRSFTATDTFTAEFDYLPTDVTTQAISLKKGANTALSFRASCKDSKTYNLTTVNGDTVTECTNFHFVLNAWHHVKIDVNACLVTLSVNGATVASGIVPAATFTDFDAVCFETLSAESAGESFYIDNFKFTSEYEPDEEPDTGIPATVNENGTAPSALIPYNTDSKKALYVNTASAASVTGALDGTAAFDAVSFDVYPESIGTDGIRVSFGNAVSLLFKRAADSAVDAPIHLYYTAGGTDTDTGITLSNGVWFTVQVMTAAADGKANLSVNGAEAVSIDASHVAVTSFKVESLGRNDAYIDNVKVTETGTEEAVYAENFEALPAGELPDGYSALGSGIAVGAGASLAVRVIGNANSVVKTVSPAVENVGDIYFEVYFDEAGYKGAHVRFYSGTTLRCGLIFSRGVQDVNAPIMLSYDDPTNKTLATNSLHKTFVPISGYEIKEGVHYQFRIAPSTKTNASILYVNGEQVSEIYTNTSLTTVDKMEVLGTGSNETLPVSIYVDNIRIYGQGSDVPVFTETFAGATAGAIPTGWVKDGKTKINLFAENYSYKQLAETSALSVIQEAGQKNASVSKNFAATETFVAEFDYLPVQLVSQGFVLKQGTKTALTVNPFCSSSKTYTLNVRSGSETTSCANSHFVMNAWNRVTIDVNGCYATVYVNGVKAAETVKCADKITAIDSLCFATLDENTTGEKFYVKNFKVTAGETVKLADVKQNMVLDTEFRTHIYFPQGEKQVTQVTFGEINLPMSEREIGGVTYDYVTVAVAAADLADAIELTVKYDYNGKVYAQTIKTNIIAYAQALKTYDGNRYETLAKAILYYAKQACPEANITADRVAANKAAAVNTVDATSPIKGASLYLGSAPQMVLALDATYTGKIRYTFNGKTIEKEVAEQSTLILDELKVANLAETISFEYEDAQQTFVSAGSYNLSAYAESVSGNAAVSALVDALYDYSVAAKNYLATR